MVKLLYKILFPVSILIAIAYFKFSTRFATTKLNNNEKFDFIVIGSGSSGCVVASRLSENPKAKVLLLESGGPDNILEVKFPPTFSKLFKTKSDWNYHTTKQASAGQRKMYWPRGRIVGGSSSLNAMIYHRGVKTDYDGWAALGNEGWAYDDVLPFFKKSETNQRRSPYYGRKGPLVISDQKMHSSSIVILAAMMNEDEEYGRFNRNFNDPENPFGAGPAQCHKKGGRRFSAADAYLSAEVLKRKNLKVVLHAHVTKLLFKTKTEVNGVEVKINGGETKQIFATKEVILSAGTINSPQILLLSGIGPKEELAKHNIPLNKELKGVGENLQDHLSFSVSYNTSLPTLNTEETLVNIVQWLVKGTGPLKSNVGEILWFGKTKYAEKDETKVGNVDLEIIAAPCTFIEHGFVKKPGNVLSAVAVGLKPKSRGTIKLASSNPLEHPLIDPRYFSNPDDLDVLVEGFKKVRKIFKTAPLIGVVSDEVWPGHKVVSKEPSVEEIKEFLRNKGETLYHPVGTCKMGHDDLSVVDSRLRVHGIKGLRVIDASIMPVILSGHTHTASVMIGEKGAHMITEDNKF